MSRKTKQETDQAKATHESAATDSVTNLKSTPYNPRKAWEEGQVEAFRRSLFEFGDLSGIVKNVRTGHLVGGNKRTDVFRTAQESEIVKTVQAPDKQGTVAHGFVVADGNRFSYREVDWDEAKEKAANLAANKWSAEWDWDGTSLLLKELKADFDLSITGFKQNELEALLNDPNEEKSSEAFPKVDENVPTEFRCPKCSYVWSGKPS